MTECLVCDICLAWAEVIRKLRWSAIRSPWSRCRPAPSA